MREQNQSSRFQKNINVFWIGRKKLPVSRPMRLQKDYLIVSKCMVWNLVRYLVWMVVNGYIFKLLLYKIHKNIFFYLFSGNGDSSITKRLHEVIPYAPKFSIEKVECRNHILRNYCQKLMNLTRITKYPCFIIKFILRNISK